MTDSPLQGTRPIKPADGPYYRPTYTLAPRKTCGKHVDPPILFLTLSPDLGISSHSNTNARIFTVMICRSFPPLSPPDLFTNRSRHVPATRPGSTPPTDCDGTNQRLAVFNSSYNLEKFGISLRCHEYYRDDEA